MLRALFAITAIGALTIALLPLQLIAVGLVTWGEPVRFDENSDRKAITRALEEAVRRMTIAVLRGRPDRSQACIR